MNKPLLATYAFFQQPVKGGQISRTGQPCLAPHSHPLKLRWVACSIIPSTNWKGARARSAEYNRRLKLRRCHHYKDTGDATRPNFNVWMDQLRTMMVVDFDFTFNDASRYGSRKDWKDYYNDRYTPYGALVEDFSNAF